MTKRRRQAGFTLAELLVVIFIIGILTAFVMANFQRGNRANDLRQAAAELQQRLRLAQGYTTGGNALKLCKNEEQLHEYCGGNPLYCNNDASNCAEAVPSGGYGFYLGGAGGYVVFADTDGSQQFNDPSDYPILNIQLISYGLSIDQVKADGQLVSFPIHLTFRPPTGAISISAGDQDITSSVTAISFMLQSSYVSNTCRLVTVNRISGQVSESASACNP